MGEEEEGEEKIIGLEKKERKGTKRSGRSKRR